MVFTRWMTFNPSTFDSLLPQLLHLPGEFLPERLFVLEVGHPVKAAAVCWGDVYVSLRAVDSIGVSVKTPFLFHDETVLSPNKGVAKLFIDLHTQVCYALPSWKPRCSGASSETQNGSSRNLKALCIFFSNQTLKPAGAFIPFKPGSACTSSPAPSGPGKAA